MATVDRSLQEARSLMSRANAEQAVGLTLVQAQALGMKEDTARACPLLRGVKDRAAGTPYVKRVNNLLESSC